MKLAHQDADSAVHNEPALLTLDVEDLTQNLRNPRSELGDLTDLIADIKANGILQPLTVTETDDHSYLLIAGHRRLNAAIRAGLHEVPAIMRADLAEPIDQLATMIGENAARSDLTVVDEARGFQAMLDLGMTQAQVAKRTGRKAKYVRASLPAAAATEEQKALINAGKITLEDLAGLEEFKDDPETRAALEAHLGGYNFGWQLARARDRRRDAAVAAAAAAELEDSGIPTITMDEIDKQSVADDDAGHPGYTWTELDEKPDLDELPDDAEVRACVTVRDGTATPTWYRRTDPTLEQETPEESHATRASREQRELHAQRDADLATAAHLRAVHLHGQILAAKNDIALTSLRELVAAKTPPGDYYAKRHAALLGFVIEDEPGKTIPAEQYLARRDTAINRLTVPQLATALYLIGTEAIDSWLEKASSWAPDAGEAWSAARILDWRKELADTWNYRPAPVEQELIDEHSLPQDPSGER